MPSLSTFGGPAVTDYTTLGTGFGSYPSGMPSNVIVPSYPYVMVAVPQPVYVPVPVAPPRPPVEMVQATVLTLRGARLPAEVRVKADTVVTWLNTDKQVCTLIFEMPAMPGATAEEARSPGTVPANGSFSLAFHQPGTYPYYLEGHPEVRTQLVVEPAPATGAGQ
jgi:plastocyanin